MQKISSTFRTCLTFCIAALFCVPTFADDKFGIGSKAPDLDIEYWMSDNDGLFEHVTKLEDDKVYVIEFWATWCGPCIMAMPHIAELQKKHEVDDVQVISVSDEDLETVEEFLKRKVRQDEEKRTYADLTATYCLTTDPDGSVYDDYFKAAGKTGIPCAFIVGKTGLVEWIGHPMQMDKPLKQVVADEWDREKFKAKYEKEQKEIEERMKLQRQMMKVLRKVGEKMQDGDEDGAIDMLDEAIQDEANEAVKEQLTGIRLQILISTNHDGLAGGLQDFIDANQDNAMDVNNLIWTIYERHEAKGDIDEEVLKVALAGAKMAAEAEPEEGAILDTYAHLVYVVEKDLDKAIEIQKRAVKHGGPQTAELKPFLNDLLEEKKTGKKPGKKKKKQRVEESDF